MRDRRAQQKVEKYRPPPSNLEAEQAHLINNETIHLVATFLQPEHFFLPVHGRIYSAVLNLFGRREIANPMTLKSYFENDQAPAEASGGRYLARLVGSAVTVINAGHCGCAIYDLLCAGDSSTSPRTCGTSSTTHRSIGRRHNRSSARSPSSSSSSRARQERAQKSARSPLPSLLDF